MALVDERPSDSDWPGAIDHATLEWLADMLPTNEWRLVYALRDGCWREPWTLVAELWRGWYRDALGPQTSCERELGLHNLRSVVYRTRAHLARLAPELHIVWGCIGDTTGYRLEMIVGAAAGVSVNRRSTLGAWR